MEHQQNVPRHSSGEMTTQILKIFELDLHSCCQICSKMFEEKHATWHMHLDVSSSDTVSARLNCPDNPVTAKAAQIVVFKRGTGGQLNMRDDCNFQ